MMLEDDREGGGVRQTWEGVLYHERWEILAIGHIASARCGRENARKISHG